MRPNLCRQIRQLLDAIVMAIGVGAMLVFALMLLALSSLNRPARSGPIADLLKTEKGTQQVFEMVCKGQVDPDGVRGCVFILQLVCGREKTARDRGACILRMFDAE